MDCRTWKGGHQCRSVYAFVPSSTTKRRSFAGIVSCVSYLKKHINSEMVFDPSEPEIDLYAFPKHDWSYSIYSSQGEEAKELLPPNMPAPLGKIFTSRCFVDVDHAGELVTKRSRTGYMVMLNNAPIYRHTKKIALIETSTF